MRCPLSTVLFNIVLLGPSHSKQNEIKEEEVSLFADDMTHIENPKESIENRINSSK